MNDTRSNSDSDPEPGPEVNVFPEFEEWIH